MSHEIESNDSVVLRQQPAWHRFGINAHRTQQVLAATLALSA